MDDSSDLEFDNLLKNVKSACKKKDRSKNVFHDKLYQSCPQKIQPRLKLEENVKCDLPELDGLRIEDGQSKNSAARPFKNKTPKLNMRLLLLSSDDDSEAERFFSDPSKEVTFHEENGDLASPKFQSHDNDKNGGLQAGQILSELLTNASLDTCLLKSPCQMPRQNLTFLFNNELPQEEVNSILVKKFQTTRRVLQSISGLEDSKRNCQSSADKDFDYEWSTANEDLKTPKKNLKMKISSANSHDEVLALTKSIHPDSLKDNGMLISTPRLSVQSSGKTFSIQHKKVTSPKSSDDENFNQRPLFLNQQSLKEGDFDSNSHVPSTPTIKIHAPGLRDGYFGSTSRKTPKSSVKFLASCLDDTLIEPNVAFGSFEPQKDNVMWGTLDYSKPVPINLYTKAGVNAFLAALSPESEIFNYDSKKYVSRFEASKIDLTNVLYYFFNKFVFDDQLPKDMTINWKSGLTSAAGYCECRYGTSLRYCTIQLSIKLLDSADKLRDTLIHELCHAAVHLINKEKDVHGPFWRVWTMTANLAFPDLPYITRCHSYKRKK